MKDISKIRIFLFNAALFFALVSCSKKNDVIPDVTVDFEISINDPRFISLNVTGGAVTVDRSTNNSPYAAGYAGSGIIIARGNEDIFYAYDRTCPYDYTLDGSAIKVNLESSEFATAKCPKCNTKYSLISFGTPFPGVGKYPLKNYKTSFDGVYVRVWNSY